MLAKKKKERKWKHPLTTSWTTPCKCRVPKKVAGGMNTVPQGRRCCVFTDAVLQNCSPCWSPTVCRVWPLTPGQGLLSPHNCRDWIFSPFYIVCWYFSLFSVVILFFKSRQIIGLSNTSTDKTSGTFKVPLVPSVPTPVLHAELRQAVFTTSTCLNAQVATTWLAD